VFGDENGDLNIWDLKSKISKTIHSKRGAIRKIRFAPGKENLRLLILYGTHTIEVFDLSKYETISLYKIQTQREKIFDCDWCTSDKPILVQNDGCVHILDINLKQMPDQLNHLKLNNVLKAENLILRPFDKYEYHALRFLLYDALRCSHTYQTLLAKQSSYFLNDLNLKNNLNWLCSNLSADAVGLLNNKPERDNLVDNYLTLTSMVYPYCRFELKFWSILKYYLDDEKFDDCEPLLIDHYFSNSKTFRLNELKLLKMYEIKLNGHNIPSTSKVNHRLINDLILCNETDKVFNILLATDTITNSNYMFDYVYACLISSLKINNFSNPNNDINIANVKSTIKLVATNLIANGKLQGTDITSTDSIGMESYINMFLFC
jgi:hypothetical protein